MKENIPNLLAKKHKKRTWPLVKRLARAYLSPYRGELAGALAMMAIAAGMTALFAAMMEPVIDEILVNGDQRKIWGVAVAILVIFLIRGFSTYFHTIMMNNIGQSIVSDIQNQMFSHFLAMDLTFFHAHPSGQLISRIVNDTTVMRTAVSESLTGIGKSLLTLVFLVGVMFYQDWRLALAAFTIFPIASFVVAWIGKRLRKMSNKIQSDTAQLSDFLSQVFLGVRLVKAYGMEDQEKKKAFEAVRKVRSLVTKAVRVGNLSGPINEILVGSVVFGVIVYGGYQVAAGNTTAGALMSFITAFTLSYEPMKRLAKLNNNLQMGLGAAERVFEVIDKKAQVVDAPEAKAVSFRQPSIVFSNVEFQYETGERRALNDVSFTIPSGKVTALVGRSGSGKTTIMNLIPRFFDPVSGSVTIDGVDLRDMTLSSLRGHIALVSQDITIFDDTVWANIGYGKAGAYRDEIIKAAIAAEADGFIRELPQAYDTRLGEEGLKLSGGQRQRIAIARAILRDAPILLLDEATSALDNEVERAIQATLAKLQVGRTTLVIAHRLSTVQNADQILVLDSGRVVEQGCHADLLQKDGIYAMMYGAGLKG